MFNLCILESNVLLVAKVDTLSDEIVCGTWIFSFNKLNKVY